MLAILEGKIGKKNLGNIMLDRKLSMRYTMFKKYT